MGGDDDGSTRDWPEHLGRWERAGGIWRVVALSSGGRITVAMETCSGEPMETFSSSDPDLAAYIGGRAMSDGSLDAGPFFHGTKAVLRPGDLISAGRSSNFGANEVANFVYMTATMDAAAWGAELAAGEGPGHIYRVQPTGPFEHDPNLTDARFRGNRTRSYRSRDPLRVIDEVADWEGHPPDVLDAMRTHVEQLRQEGVTAIND